jgi:hypothetical protein
MEGIVRYVYLFQFMEMYSFESLQFNEDYSNVKGLRTTQKYITVLHETLPEGPKNILKGSDRNSNNNNQLTHTLVQGHPACSSRIQTSR